MLAKRTYRHFSFCCGLNSGGDGFSDSSLQIAKMLAKIDSVEVSIV